ncbi:hypothetical protein BGW39_005061 [Mortierella sp. 14UC]|nr:hypothetical protein BGW39_005061 [Mortierella sp. 14UC]
MLGDWGGPKTIGELNPKAGFPAVTDFTTNQVYVVNGYLEPTMVIAATDPGSGGGDGGGDVSPNALPSLTMPLMMRYDGATGAISSVGVGSGFEIVDNAFAGCWSSIRNSLFLHGGIVGSPVNVYQKTLYEFTPSNPKYTTIADTGAAPSARFGHLYNLKTGEWQSTFSPARVVTPSSTNSGALRPSSAVDEQTDGSSSSGALVGGIVGGLAVIGAIAGFMFYRRRAARKQQKQDKKMSFSTYSALPVVATRMASSSDDSLPEQGARNGKQEKDDEEDDGGGVVYVVEAPVASTSVASRSLRNSSPGPRLSDGYDGIAYKCLYSTYRRAAIHA